jgi:hypothetical protein
MSKQELIQTIISLPSSAFSEKDRGAMEVLPEDVLHRMYMSMSMPEVPAPAAPRENTGELLEELAEVQDDLKYCIQTEGDLLRRLNAAGVAKTSVIPKPQVHTVNTAAVSQNPQLNDMLVKRYLETQRTPLTAVVQEGLTARNEIRQQAIETIVTNAAGVYSHEDLMQMSSNQLNKLSSALATKRAANPISDFTLNGLANGYTPVVPNNTHHGGGVISEDPLEVPRLW